MIGQQFGLAFDVIGESQRRITEVRLIHRWSKWKSNRWSLPVNEVLFLARTGEENDLKSVVRCEGQEFEAGRH